MSGPRSSAEPRQGSLTTSDAHDALVALAGDLVQELAAARAEEILELGHPGNIPGGPIKPPPLTAGGPARQGAWAVFPHLGNHLLTQFAGDTVSSIAHRHVPKPLGLPEPIQRGVLSAERLAEAHEKIPAPPRPEDKKKPKAKAKKK